MNTKLAAIPSAAVVVAVLSIKADDSKAPPRQTIISHICQKRTVVAGLEFVGLFSRLLIPSWVVLIIAILCYAKNKELRRHVKNLICSQRSALVEIVP